MTEKGHKVEVLHHPCCQSSLEGKRRSRSKTRRGNNTVNSPQEPGRERGTEVWGLMQKNGRRSLPNDLLNVCGCRRRSGGESRCFPSFEWQARRYIHTFLRSAVNPRSARHPLSSLVRSDHALIHEAVYQSCWLCLPFYMLMNTLLLVLMGAVCRSNIIVHN